MQVVALETLVCAGVAVVSLLLWLPWEQAGSQWAGLEVVGHIHSSVPEMPEGVVAECRLPPVGSSGIEKAEGN